MGPYSERMLLASLLSAVALAAPCQTFPAAPGTQLITIEVANARSTRAVARTWARAGKCWRAVHGPYPARVGRNGISSNRREGDGTTPAGTYSIAPTMYGNEPNPGVQFRYHRLRCGDWWSEDPGSPTYNSFQHVPCGREPSFEVETPGMWQQPRAYPFLAVVEFNMNPTVPGRGSGIFLHAQTGGPTNGCISLRRADLLRVLRWLRPTPRPHIAIGPTSQLGA